MYLTSQSQCISDKQWRQTRCCPCSTCYTTFPAPPRIYVYKHAPHFCPAPNLFSMCTTSFKPRLAPLAMFNDFQEKPQKIKFQVHKYITNIHAIWSTHNLPIHFELLASNIIHTVILLLSKQKMWIKEAVVTLFTLFCELTISGSIRRFTQ